MLAETLTALLARDDGVRDNCLKNTGTFDAELIECGVFLDATVGGGGHAEAILKKTAPAGRLIGIDWDTEAIAASKERLEGFGTRVDIIKGNFADVDKLLSAQGIEALDGALLDLGVSSPQLLNPERGFSFLHEAPLDMRMSREDARISAQEIVQSFTPQRLAEIIKDYGEERMAKAIAKAICRQRSQFPIVTTTQLANIIAAVVRRHGRLHPATRTFQALRIAVNAELTNLSSVIPKLVSLLKKGARMVIISFHSLEDRIVKRAFQELASSGEPPYGFPVGVCPKQPLLKIITKKPLTPSTQEMSENPAARSAKLRVAERI